MLSDREWAMQNYPDEFEEDWDSEDEEDDPEDYCIMCGKSLPIEGFCCEPACLAAACGEDYKENS